MDMSILHVLRPYKENMGMFRISAYWIEETRLSHALFEHLPAV
jgi:hypothetical protein